MPIQTIPVQSTAISAVQYDPASMTLRVIFRSYGEHTYPGIPKSLFEAFLSAPSKGRFFNQQIRPRSP